MSASERWRPQPQKKPGSANNLPGLGEKQFSPSLTELLRLSAATIPFLKGSLAVVPVPEQARKTEFAKCEWQQLNAEQSEQPVTFHGCE